MTLRRFSLPATPTARASTGLALLTLIGAGIAAANTEALVVGRFTAALEAPAQQVAIETDPKRPLVAGSEAYWLTEKRHPNAAGAALEPAAWSVAPFAADLTVGDRITFSGAKGKRVLEVISVTNVEPAEGTPTNGARDLAVTCRDTDGRSLTFIIPADPAARTT
ncbi:hypothetical protein [Hyphomicrobium sp. CS1GBMeth3]|uniref:hypothetical protein n=1 Tax=Hyphomicrobium sp. CS1GBMeth3 TaxID=1892845 RepID=UPI0009312FB9|nr:hypothetical protein [Hyphomicrobium sp. CS1GBMeth3]